MTLIVNEPPELIETLPCPFCGAQPVVFPEDWQEEGDGYGEVQCINPKCKIKPQAEDLLECASDGLPDEGPHSGITISINCRNAAIRNWNVRSGTDGS